MVFALNLGVCRYVLQKKMFLRILSVVVPATVQALLNLRLDGGAV